MRRAVTDAANEMMYCENIPSGISLGRIDYYLYPFYQKDDGCRKT